MLLKRRSEKADVLKGVPLFKELSGRHLSLIARHADEVTVDEGKVLTRQGELGREFLLILEGRARVERDGQVIARLGADEFFGEMSLIDGKARSATVTATTPMTLLVIETRSFRSLLAEIPELQKKILLSLCERLRLADAGLALRN